MNWRVLMTSSVFLMMVFLRGAVFAAPEGSTTGGAPRAAWRDHAQFYAGLFVPHRGLSGDFDGERFYMNDTSGAVVPTVPAEFGWGLSAGVKSKAHGNLSVAVDLNYSQSNHDGDWMGAKIDSVYRLLSMDLKLYGNARNPLQPYALVGLSAPSLELKKGAFKGMSSERGTYDGNGVNVGFGLLYYLSDVFAIHVQPVYRIMRFNELEIDDERGELNKKLNASQLDVEMGVTLRFGVGRRR